MNVEPAEAETPPLTATSRGQGTDNPINDEDGDMVMLVEMVDGKPRAVQPKSGHTWISLLERLPEVGQPVWIRFSKRDGTPEPRKPVLAADFIEEIVGGFSNTTWFVYGPWRSIYMPPAAGPFHGLRHWQPRLDDVAPAVGIVSVEEDMPTQGQNPKRHYRLTPEGLEAKRKAMREYWQMRKAATSGQKLR